MRRRTGVIKHVLRQVASGPELHTDRLRLRRWKPTDLAPFAALNADPVVMRYFPATLSWDESAAAIRRIDASFDELGYGLWAVEVTGVEQLIGFVGLSIPRFKAPFLPAVEVGWRLAKEYWGRGYATEGARAALRYGFSTAGLQEIISLTTVSNQPSRRVMERLGMRRDPTEDFDHPSLPERHPLRRHVLYRICSATTSVDQQQPG